jgi:hypothetical protein
MLKIKMPFAQQEDIIYWFCSSLRKGKNILSHYLDDISGCGNYLEEGSVKRFFDIIKSLVSSLKESTEKKEIIIYLSALKWKYSARDHHYLN